MKTSPELSRDDVSIRYGGQGISNYPLAIATVSRFPRSLYIFQEFPVPSAYSSMIFSVASFLVPSRRQVMNMLVWRVRSSRPPIRKTACWAAGMLRRNTGLSGLAGRVHIFWTWTASRVRHSRSKAGISGRGTTVPGIGRPFERTSEQN